METPTKAADHARAWRENHPDSYEKSKRRQAARRKALVRLAQMHPDDFQDLYADELLKP